MFSGSITEISGIEVGHAQNFEGGTGCTVILCREGAIAGVDIRGSAPGTRETDLLRPCNLIERVHAVMLSGGSAFGLSAADGAMEFLEKQSIGFDVGIAKVPIVSSAVLFDLNYKSAMIRPDKNMGYQACLNANSGTVQQGSVGAGTGATIGKIAGVQNATKGGIGTASIKINGLIVGAIVAVNSFGDCINPETGEIIAGARDPKTGKFLDTKKLMLAGGFRKREAFSNTTIGVIATNARLNKEQANKVAAMSHDGMARCINPVHTMLDGDTIFALSAGDFTEDINLVGVAAAEALSRAIINAALFSN